MSFYDPLAPVFESTRLEIERTIMGLEERLLRRKELDLQLENDLIQQESLQRVRHLQNGLYDPIERGYSAQVQLQKRLRELRTFDPRENLLPTYPQRQTLELDYLTRLRQIQKHQSVLEHELRLNSHITASQPNYYLPQQHHKNIQENPLDESGEMLARKYFDGTRVYEYNQELKKSTDKLPKYQDFSKEKPKGQLFFNQTIRNSNPKQQTDHSTVKKYELSGQKPNLPQNQSNHKTFTISKQSPIKQIDQSSKYNSSSGNFANNQELKGHLSHRKHNKIHERSEEFYSNDNSPQLQPKNMQRSRSKQNPVDPHIPDGSHSRKQSLSRSRPKSSTKYLSSKQKSSHNLHYHSATKSGLASFGEEIPIEQKFKLWFRQRSRLAEEAKQIYEIKYAKNLPEYLLTVCEKEDKLRKELKEKICKIPSVQRKYDVGPVLQ